MDALALRAEEGRGKLRKATTSCKQAETRRYPNGKTCMEQYPYILYWIHRYKKATRGTETSKYPEEEKENSIPLVAASEEGRAQTESSDSGL